ncbi:hypothetical protein ILUMI_22456 [Ignelater luminosus]|uniref:Lipase domain-containing protein n=1 Tax=Ignelater luminosus TaxID=2038154 RepID=A0A8K0CEF8_IGNLU|nr:hypothetical protein ILUMI_22456 [Ignelater luminosus]
MSELPEGIQGELISIITEGVIHDFFGCPDDVEINEDDVKLFLFTRQNEDTPVLINKSDPIQLDTTKPIKLLLPGWLCNITNDEMPDLKNSYLQAYDCNVIALDWTKYSIDLYTNSFCFIPEIAKVLGKFLCYLQTDLNVSLSEIHVLGHSMGGQMAGFVGQETQKQCGVHIGRISGLDPAGPLYQGLDESRRLDESDAVFVDVIHTNERILGYYGPCGTVDFFVNCGMQQNGCTKVDPEDIANTPLSIIGCNHLRSITYMNESIPSDNFVATSCAGCSGIVDVCGPDLIDRATTKMGEHLTEKPSRAKYWCPTNSEPPYAKG